MGAWEPGEESVKVRSRWERLTEAVFCVSWTEQVTQYNLPPKLKPAAWENMCGHLSVIETSSAEVQTLSDSTETRRSVETWEGVWVQQGGHKACTAPARSTEGIPFLKTTCWSDDGPTYPLPRKSAAWQSPLRFLGWKERKQVRMPQSHSGLVSLSDGIAHPRLQGSRKAQRPRLYLAQRWADETVLTCPPRFLSARYHSVSLFPCLWLSVLHSHLLTEYWGTRNHSLVLQRYSLPWRRQSFTFCEMRNKHSISQEHPWILQDGLS